MILCLSRVSVKGMFKEGMIVESQRMNASFGTRIPLEIGAVDRGDGKKILWNKVYGETVEVHRQGDDPIHSMFFSSSDRMLFPLDDLQSVK